MGDAGESCRSQLDVDDEHHFVALVQGPGGRRYEIEGRVTFGMEGEVFFAAPTGPSPLRWLLRALNRPLVAAQRPKSHHNCTLEVVRVGDSGTQDEQEKVVLEEDLSDMIQGRRRAYELAVQLSSGALVL